MDENELELWDQVQTAAWLKVSPKTLTVWRSHREGPTPTYIGRQPCYLRSDVIAWIKEQRAATESWRAP